MTIFEELKNNYERRDSFHLEKKMIEEQRKQIIKEYDEKLKVVNNNIKYTDNMREKITNDIAKYGVFNTNDISEAIVKLLNTLTDKNFVLVRKAVQFFYVGKLYANLIVNSEVDSLDFHKEKLHEYNDLYEYYNDPNKAILMGLKDKKISFYYTFLNTNFGFEMQQATDYGDFNDYIYDFIRELVDFKYQNKKEDLTKEELDKFLDNYLKKYKKSNAKVLKK